MATLLKNTSQAALTLPPPYGGVLGAGKEVVLFDPPATVIANIGSAVGNAVVLATDTTDSPTPGYNAVAKTTPVSITATPATLLNNQDLALVNVASACTVNLPTNPTIGETHVVKDSGGHAAADTITVKTTDGSTIDGVAGTTGQALASTNYTSSKFVYGASGAWFSIT